jgi:hypothetical protein
MKPVLGLGLTDRVLAYALAAVIGLCWVGLVFPAWALHGALPPGSPTNADLAQHIMGQRYLWHDAWHWRHPLWAQTLDAPYGVMIGFTDSIPLPTLLLKPFVPLLPAHFQAITLWLAFCWVMQPVAGVFALRSAGEKRVGPALAIAACASAMPSFLARLSHAALSSHFTLLLGLGLALRIVDPALSRTHGARALLGACLLIPVLLLIHPYLLMMDVIVTVSAPATLFLRHDRRWRGVALAIGIALVATVGLADLLGYFQGENAVAGFGYYSMNLLSPLWPSASGLLRGMAPSGLDATGGQYEGFQYLGAGLLLGMAVTITLYPTRLVTAVRQHPGLLLACLLLCAVAVSTSVYLGHWRLMVLPAPGFMGVFRVSGRFFWPVAYVLLVAVVAVLARAPRRVAAPMLVAMALLQTIDGSALATQDRAEMSVDMPYSFDAPALARLMAQSRFIDIHPAWPCDASIAGAVDLMAVLSVASRSMVPIDTAYTARATHQSDCNDARTVAVPLAPGELRILLPARVKLAPLVPGHTRFCRQLGTLAVCRDDAAQ